MRSTMDGERDLRRMLAEVDQAIKGDADADDGWDLSWEVWASLPFEIRDLLLWSVRRWWILPAPTVRRLLVTAAGLIVWRGVTPLAALERAGVRLRLPPPRRVPPRARPRPPAAWPARARRLPAFRAPPRRFPRPMPRRLVRPIFRRR